VNACDGWGYCRERNHSVVGGITDAIIQKFREEEAKRAQDGTGGAEMKEVTNYLQQAQASDFVMKRLADSEGLTTKDTVTPENAKEQIERRMSELVDLLATFPEMKGKIDPHAWSQLEIYSPNKLRWRDFSVQDKATWPTVPGQYMATIKGDSEAIDGHVIYSFDAYQTLVTVGEIDPDDGEDGSISISGPHDETQDFVIALCGPLRIPDYKEDEELEYDLTKPDLVKPPGGEVTVQLCFDALLLVDWVRPSSGTVVLPAWSNDDFERAYKIVEQWTQDDRDRAYDYAIRMHFMASDNEDVYVPEKPACLMAT
jgi:hypothetical protein